MASTVSRASRAGSTVSTADSGDYFIQDESFLKPHEGLSDRIKCGICFLIVFVLIPGLAVGVYIGLTSRDGSGPDPGPDSATAFLVESLPLGNFTVPLPDGVISTTNALLMMINNAEFTLDLSVMYWNLNATASPDCATFTPEELSEMGADEGIELLNALYDAAERGIVIRILQGSLNSGTEGEDLANRYPNNVQIRTWDPIQWYGGGTMHQNLWVTDGRDFYIGSADMDWIALTQAKEIGILMFDAPTLASDLLEYFNTWWAWASPSFVSRHPTATSVLAWDTRFQATLRTPCWSDIALNTPYSCSNPFALNFKASLYNLQNPFTLYINQTESASHAFVTGSPREVFPPGSQLEVSVEYRPGEPPQQTFSYNSHGTGRTFDEIGLLYTLADAQKFVDLSVTEFDTVDEIQYQDGPVVVWQVLSDMLMKLATTKGVTVRILASLWANTNKMMIPYLQNMQTSFALCKRLSPPCPGQLNIRLFAVPGWNMTGTNQSYPSHSRVNQAKYIVTDRRVNIGTNNMQWSYFYQSAGVSFNSDDNPLREQLAEIFNLDWNSPYASALPSGA